MQTIPGEGDSVTRSCCLKETVSVIRGMEMMSQSNLSLYSWWREWMWNINFLTVLRQTIEHQCSQRCMFCKVKSNPPSLFMKAFRPQIVPCGLRSHSEADSDSWQCSDLIQSWGVSGAQWVWELQRLSLWLSGNEIALQDPWSSWPRPMVLGIGNQVTLSYARGNFLLIDLSCTL